MGVLLNIIVFIEILLILLFLGPKLFGIKPFVVTSGSMEPLYTVGSLIYVKEINPNDIEVNDSITFYIENSDIVATHQVYEIDKKNDFFKTQGINNKDENGNIIHDVSPVKFSSLIGKPVLCIPYLGYINSFVTKPIFICLTLIITISVILLYNFLERKFEVK